MMSWSILTLLILAVCQAQAACPKGWIKFEDTCYFFSSKKTTWYKASLDCYARDGHLAIVESPQKDGFLLTIAKAKTANFWIDGNDDVLEGNWKWSFSQKPIRYNNWDKADGEPDGKTNQNCLALYKSNKGDYYKWYDIQCSASLFYICEIEQEVQQESSCEKFLLQELFDCKRKIKN